MSAHKGVGFSELTANYRNKQERQVNYVQFGYKHQQSNPTASPINTVVSQITKTPPKEKEILETN